jgi:uncharacterized membrane protein
MQFRELTERIRHSLWFIPSLSVVAATIAALVLVGLASWFGQDTDLPFVFSAGPDGARAMLSAIGGSVITVAGTLFSITIVALQLTSTQFSPRVLRNFLRDRANQVVLGVFIGTFTYSLLVLRTIRSEDETGGAAFVPGLAVTGGLVLAFVSLGMLIYFIHHVSVRIQVTTILASVVEDALETVRHLATWSEPRDDRGWRPATAPTHAAPPPPSGAVPPSAVPATAEMIGVEKSGYLQLVDLEALVEDARNANGRYELLVAPGAWVQAHAPLASFVPAATADRRPPSEHAERLADAIVLTAERSLQQDAAFGLQQLADIGMKALSPSVNDPTTAINAIDRLGEVLVATGRAPDVPRAFADEDGVVRLEVPFPGFDQLAALAFEGMRFYGATTPAVALHLARTLSQLAGALPPERHPALRREARLLAEAAEGIELVSARRDVLEAVKPLLG